jgi:hypothetical protein
MSEKRKNIFRYLWENPQYSMPLIIFIWAFIYFFWGYIISVNNGFGYDGNYYGTTAKKFFQQVFGGELTFYRIQRVFPSFVISCFLNILNLPKENYYVVKLWQIYNMVLLQVCVLIWIRISKMYRLELKYVWLGFVFAIVNFANLVVTFWYPVLTDSTAFTLGFLLLYFHLKNNLTGKIVVSILGALTWPSFMYYGILMIIFPMSSKVVFAEEPDKKRINLMAFLIPVPFLFLSSYYIYKYFAFGQLFPYVKKAVPFIDVLFPVAIVLNYILMVYIFKTFLPSFSLKRYVQFITDLLKGIKLKHVLISVIMYAAVFTTLKYLSNPEAGGQSSSFMKVFYCISLYSTLKPLGYVLVAITCYGPAFILMYFFLKRYKPFMESLGFGVVISFLITILLMFTSETRLVSNFIPFIILFTILVLKDMNMSNRLYTVLIIFSLILSKFYIPLNGIPIEAESAYDFPNQLAFMNTFTFSNLAYLVQLPIIGTMIVTVILIVRKDTKMAELSE